MDDELLEAIYARPEDDAPRLVYADVLLERGDPRGELITLHLLATRTPEQEKRLSELFRDVRLITEHSFPLCRGGRVSFRRGFPDEIWLDRAKAKNILGDRTFLLITRIHLEGVAPALAAKFLDHPTLANVRFVEGLTPKIMQRLARKPRRWTEIESDACPPHDLLATLGDLESLGLHVDRVTRAQLEGCPRLKRLKLVQSEPAAPDLFHPLVELEWLQAFVDLGDGSALEGSPIRTLVLKHSEDGERIPSIVSRLRNLRELTASTRMVFDVMTVLRAAPTLERATFSFPSFGCKIDGDLVSIERGSAGWHLHFGEAFRNAVIAKRITRCDARGNGSETALRMAGLHSLGLVHDTSRPLV